jgi:hypothetical protein
MTIFRETTRKWREKIFSNRKFGKEFSESSDHTGFILITFSERSDHRGFILIKFAKSRDGHDSRITETGDFLKI